MAKVSWSCVEVSCCVPNCQTPCFHPKISHTISNGLPSPLSAFSPISSCKSRPLARSQGTPSASCCERTHKHFLYSIVLPTSVPIITANSQSTLQAWEKTTPPTTSIDAAPIVTPITPPERPSLRARRGTLSKLKIPESPPLSSPPLLSQVQSPSGRPPSRNHHNRSSGPSRYPDMFLPMPIQIQAAGGSRTVSPMSTTYTPLLSRDILAMSPISPLMHSNNPSPIMGAA